MDVDHPVARGLALLHRTRQRPVIVLHRLAVFCPAALIATALDQFSRQRTAPDQAALRIAHDQPATGVGDQHADRQAVENLAQQCLALRQRQCALFHQLLHALEQAGAAHGHGQLSTDRSQGVEPFVWPALAMPTDHVEHADGLAAEQQRDAGMGALAGLFGQCRTTCDVARGAQSVAEPGVQARTVDHTGLQMLDAV
ncbi:hypothetical protein D3C84_676530 [compost metagenome]